jgi:hypothetical protein
LGYAFACSSSFDRCQLGVDQLFGKIDDGFAKGLMRSAADWDLIKAAHSVSIQRPNKKSGFAQPSRAERLERKIVPAQKRGSPCLPAAYVFVQPEARAFDAKKEHDALRWIAS